MLILNRIFILSTLLFSFCAFSQHFSDEIVAEDCPYIKLQLSEDLDQPLWTTALQNTLCSLTQQYTNISIQTNLDKASVAHDLEFCSQGYTVWNNAYKPASFSPDSPLISIQINLLNDFSEKETQKFTHSDVVSWVSTAVKSYLQQPEEYQNNSYSLFSVNQGFDDLIHVATFYHHQNDRSEYWHKRVCLKSSFKQTMSGGIRITEFATEDLDDEMVSLLTVNAELALKPIKP